MDYSPPGSPVHGIFQARILDWVVMPSSRGIFPTQRFNLKLLSVLDFRQVFFFFLLLSHHGSPVPLMLVPRSGVTDLQLHREYASVSSWELIYWAKSSL